MFFISVMLGSALGVYVGSKFIYDKNSAEGELGMLAWALVGVIGGCLAATFLGFV